MDLEHTVVPLETPPPSSPSSTEAPTPVKRGRRRWFEPHSSIVEIGARRQARLAMILALAVAVANFIGMCWSAIASGFTPQFVMALVVTLCCLTAYFCGRTRYQQAGPLILVVSLSISALGIATDASDPNFALLVIVPITLIIGSALLPVVGMGVLTAFNVLAVAVMPVWDSNFEVTHALRNAGVFLIAGTLLTVVNLFRNEIEKNRMAKLQGLDELRALQADMERLVAERTQSAEQARQEAEAARHAAVAQVWQTVGLARLSDAMRGEQDIPMLAHNVIRQLCRYLDAPIGAIFVADGEVLKLAGGYAYTLAPGLSDQFQLGEGLVGQSALEKRMLTLTDIPRDYIAITSGLGDTLPRSVAISPFVYNDQVVGVVEIGTLTTFTQAQLGFLQQAMENIAIAFNTAEARARINELLEQTQRQASELRAQEEELRSANEELEAQAESLRASEGRLREKQSQLEALNAELEEKAAALQQKR